MKIYPICFLFSLLSFSIQASPLKISVPVKNVTVGFNTLVIAPSNPSVLYGMNRTRTPTRYIYRSIDAGQHWQELPITQYLYTLVVSPTNPRTLYALSDDDTASSNTNLFKSEDGGETWQAAFSDSERAQNCPQSTTNTKCLSFNTIGIDRSNGLTLYGTGSQGAFLKKSVDGGKMWKSIIPEQSMNYYGLLLANDGYIDPSHVAYMQNGNAIYDSNDAGVTWKKLEFSLPNPLQKPSWLTQAETVPEVLSQLWLSSQGSTNVMYSNLFSSSSSGISNYALKSNDYGITWQRILPSGGIAEKIVGISPSDSNTLYATTGTNGNLMRSKDAGNTWVNLVFPDTTAGISAFVFSPVNAKEIYVSTSNESNTSGVYKSSDGGDTWETLKTGININLKVTNITPTIQKDTVIVQLSNAEFYRTTDAGDSFKKINYPVLGGYRTEIIGSNNKAGTLYTTFYTAFEYTFFRGQELYRSDDLGETWQRISPWKSGTYNLKFFQSSDGKTLYSSKITVNSVTHAEESYEWYYSEDFGNTWQAINAPIPKFTLTLHPSDPNIFYIMGCAAFRSTDKGKTWQDIKINLAKTVDCAYTDERLLSDPRDANTLYFLNVARPDQNYDVGYRSTDAGVTWNPIKAPSNYSVRLTRASQLDPKTGFLYLADLQGVNYRSTDGGDTWVELKNLPIRNAKYWANLITITKHGLYLVVSEASVVTYRSVDNGDSWQWVSNASSEWQIDPWYNRFFTSNESSKGKLGIFTVDEQAIANPQSTISDAQGYNYPSSRDGVKTFVDSLPTTNKQLTQNTDTHITATFSPSAEYQNQSAELLIVSQFQPKGSDQSSWFIQTNNTWQPWDGSEANLKPAKTVSSLQATETLDVFTGKPLGLSGTLRIYTAYRIPSQGVMISNKSIPLVLNVE